MHTPPYLFRALVSPESFWRWAKPALAHGWVTRAVLHTAHWRAQSCSRRAGWLFTLRMCNLSIWKSEGNKVAPSWAINAVYHSLQGSEWLGLFTQSFIVPLVYIIVALICTKVKQLGTVTPLNLVIARYITSYLLCKLLCV